MQIPAMVYLNITWCTPRAAYVPFDHYPRVRAFGYKIKLIYAMALWRFMALSTRRNQKQKKNKNQLSSFTFCRKISCLIYLYDAKNFIQILISRFIETPMSSSKYFYILYIFFSFCFYKQNLLNHAKTVCSCEIIIF